MRLTRAGEYAVRCSLYLAFRGQGVVTNRREIARAMEIPTPFLGKIAQQLARAGIIEIVQGPKGGYRLLPPPEELTLLAVVEAVIGEIYLNDCVIRPESCGSSRFCPVHRVWERVRDQLRDSLRRTHFQAMLADEGCRADLAARSVATERKPAAG